MRLLIREYLASLRERDELDAILPELLSELGYTVYSRPSRGTRQYGVDVAAIGPDNRLYLFSIKRGDLTRVEWNSDSAQALRPSLDEIRDVYIPSHVPEAYQGLKIVICLCFGGDVQEQVRAGVSGYMRQNTTDRISYEEWNGDKIAGFIESGLLGEGLLTRQMRSSFRKAVAMVDEPDTSFAHFTALVRELLVEAEGASRKARITAARQICICLWILFVWARDASNVESPYLSSELAMLSVWHLTRDILVDGRSAATDAGLVVNQLAELHFQVWDELVSKKILPHAGERYAVSAAVGSSSPLDVNLKMFDLLGRIALRGLWMIWSEPGNSELPVQPEAPARERRIAELAERICALMAANPVLLSPVSDDQAVDLALAFMFLAAQGGAHTVLVNWVREIVARAQYAFHRHRAYPCIHSDYRELADHPRDDSDTYREAATAASVLWPTLAVWAAALGDAEASDVIAKFCRDSLSHCNFQLWLPDESSENLIYVNRESHGGAFTNIPVAKGTRALLEYVLRECGGETPFFRLSAVELGHWPLVAMACRHHRLPVPPHLWLGFLPGVDLQRNEGMSGQRSKRSSQLDLTSMRPAQARRRAGPTHDPDVPA